MKYLIIINGPMGCGKTSTAQALKNNLINSVHLDADWLWDINPFNAAKEYKDLVYDNCHKVLNNYIDFPDLKYIIFSWVMTKKMRSNLLNNLNLSNIKVIDIILDINNQELKNRWTNKNELWRTNLHWEKVALDSIEEFNNMDGIHINTVNKSINDVVKEIRTFLN